MRVIRRLKLKQGLTLVEVMVSAVVFVLAFIGMMLTYTKCMQFNELAKNSSKALSASRMQMEEIRNTPFAQIASLYNNQSFDVSGFTGKGVSYVDLLSGVSDALQITVNVSWRQPNGLIVGEDENLNGQLDSGEDTDGNGRLSSDGVQLISVVYQE